MHDLHPEFTAELKSALPVFSQTAERYVSHSLCDYSRLLWQTGYKITPDSYFCQAIRQHFSEINIADKAEVLIKQLSDMPVLQTAHHLTPTLGPVFNTVDIISLQSLPQEAIYPAAVCSGVAYSNSARSGALCFEYAAWEDILMPGAVLHSAVKSQREREAHGDPEKRISLIPSRLRDGLLYGSLITEQTVSVVSALTEKLKPYFPPPEIGTYYSDWAVRVLNLIQQKIHHTVRYTAFDLNRVAALYISSVIRAKDDKHPLYKLLYNKTLQQKLFEINGNEDLFLTEKPGGKSVKVQTIKLNDWSVLHEEYYSRIIEGKLCPGVFLVFFITAFLNRIKCLGSFNQGDYLARYFKCWEKLFPEYNIPVCEFPALTTGRAMLNGQYIYSLDFLSTGRLLDYAPLNAQKMGGIWGKTVVRLAEEVQKNANVPT